MSKSKTKHYLFKGILIVSLPLLYLLFFGFVSDDHRWILLFMQLVTFTICLFICFKTSMCKPNLLLLLIPFLCLMVIGILIEKNGYIRGLPYIVLLPLISYSAIYIVRKKVYVIATLLLLIFPINSFILFPNWLIYNIEAQSETIAVGTEIPNLNLIDQNGDRVELLENKMIILDFWTTNCGVCFKKFPDFERIMKKYDSNSNIVFYAVNMPIKRDTFPETVALVNKLNYSFKTLYAIDRKAIEHQMNFNLYPQIIVVKNNKIVYSGGFNSGKAIFISNLESIIEKNK